MKLKEITNSNLGGLELALKSNGEMFVCDEYYILNKSFGGEILKDLYSS